MLSDTERHELLRVARRAIAAHLSGETPAPPLFGALPESAGVFVTLRAGGALRGCIGSLETAGGLLELVVYCAIASATEDPRFPPVSGPELDEVDVEISLLTPPELIHEPTDIEVGRHGLIVEQGSRRGLLLPQVPLEWGWDREVFLEQTCLKAGLRPDAWKTGARVLRFEAEVFGEGD